VEIKSMGQAQDAGESPGGVSHGLRHSAQLLVVRTRKHASMIAGNQGCHFQFIVLPGKGDGKFSDQTAGRLVVILATGCGAHIMQYCSGAQHFPCPASLVSKHTGTDESIKELQGKRVVRRLWPASERMNDAQVSSFLKTTRPACSPRGSRDL